MENDRQIQSDKIDSLINRLKTESNPKEEDDEESELMFEVLHNDDEALRKCEIYAENFISDLQGALQEETTNSIKKYAKQSHTTFDLGYNIANTIYSSILDEFTSLVQKYGEEKIEEKREEIYKAIIDSCSNNGEEFDSKQFVSKVEGIMEKKGVVA